MNALTFTSADDKVLSCSAKVTPNDKRALLLPLKATHNLCCVDVDKLNLAFSKIHEHVA